MRRPASALLAAALALAGCDGPRQGGQAAFDDAMRRLQQRGEATGAGLPTVAGGSAVLPDAPPAAR
ncbi:hypothetical protein, partial [Craurococcus roseus]|uniref:hypothetical protein n=1 Tax=Craurococcus roseus TaxID=77585 RepID=UPI0031D93B70